MTSKTKVALFGLFCAALLGGMTPVDAATRAVLIGSGNYTSPAIADLRGPPNDLEAMRAMMAELGVSDVIVLKDDQATRSAVERSLYELGQRAAPGDWIILYYSGHGSQARAPDAGQAGQADDALIQFVPLSGFDPANQQADQFIADRDFYAWLQAYIPAQARILMMVDSCHSGTMQRTVVPGLFGYTARTTLNGADGPLQLVARPGPQFPVLTALAPAADVAATRQDLPNLVYFGASQDDQLALETELPGQGGPSRGLLTFAFEQGLLRSGSDPSKSAADLDRDGSVTVQEMAAYLNGQIHNLSANRQDSSAIFAEPMANQPLLAQPAVIPRPVDSPAAPSLIVVGYDGPDLGADPAWRLVPRDGIADFLWNYRSGHVYRRSGDLVAEGVADAAALHGVIGKWQTVQRLAPLVAEHAIRVALTPAGSDMLYPVGAQVEISLTQRVRERATPIYATVFNLASDGTVQLLYPLGNDSGLIPPGNRSLDVLTVEVTRPFGTDHVVAVTTSAEPAYLRATLRSADGQRASSRLVEPVMTELRSAGAAGAIVITELYTGQ